MRRRGRHIVAKGKPWRLSILAGFVVRFGGVVVSGNVAPGRSGSGDRNASTGWLGVESTRVSLALSPVPSERSCSPHMAEVSDLSERISRIGRRADKPEATEPLLDKAKLFLSGRNALVEVELVGFDARNAEVETRGGSFMRRREISDGRSLEKDFVDPGYQVRKLNILLPDRSLYSHNSPLCFLDSLPGTAKVLEECLGLPNTGLEVVDCFRALLDLVIKPVGIPSGKWALWRLPIGTSSGCRCSIVLNPKGFESGDPGVQPVQPLSKVVLIVNLLPLVRQDHPLKGPDAVHQLIETG